MRSAPAPSEQSALFISDNIPRLWDGAFWTNFSPDEDKEWLLKANVRTGAIEVAACRSYRAYLQGRFGLGKGRAGVIPDE